MHSHFMLFTLLYFKVHVHDGGNHIMLAWSSAMFMSSFCFFRVCILEMFGLCDTGFQWSLCL